MNTFCVDLNIGIEPLANPDMLKNLDKDLYMHVFPTVGYVNPAFIIFMNKLGVVVDHIEIFYSHANYFTPIHRDVNKAPTDTENVYDFIKLNYLYGGKNSLMKWYKPLENVQPINKQIPNNQNTVYVTSDGFRLNDIELLHEQAINFPSIVQVGIPHNVQNFDEDRYCLCVVLTKNGKRLSMNNAIDIFKEYISE